MAQLCNDYCSVPGHGDRDTQKRERGETETQREGGRERWGGGGGRENSNSKTLFYKDCSLGERERERGAQLI